MCVFFFIYLFIYNNDNNRKETFQFEQHGID